ncbi:MAG TPA: nucleotidyltransferase domain-containing protein [Phycisphaerae bacterium]|jgi:predicted nucleotidyltransferase|nr:nucleotidyltransferase domain-containing protein [Phycisphaerae bacterium]HPC21139.1 nucleotidyltransferase domain-containing protein [Phycisphaerae bacterium]HRS26752.1 nucleotidyltransferase domain-containing protein [Phycisphaerae bacterium]HRT42497.1 nucleotidyltransferase domain-containing protein [Phycisphaerae bacterium]
MKGERPGTRQTPDGYGDAAPGVMPEFSQDMLAEIIRRLVAALTPRAIYFFGSHAYGTPHRDSDIDLLIVLDHIDSIMDVARRGYGALFGLGLPIELHFITAEKLERYSGVIGSFHREVKTRGRIVYAA